MDRSVAVALVEKALADSDFNIGEEITVVTRGGSSAVMTVVKTSPKAVQLKNDNPHGSPDAKGKTVWLPRKALKPNPTYTYKDFKAYSIAPWMLKKLDSYQRIALEMAAY